MNILKLFIFFIGIFSTEGLFFRKEKKESLEYGRSFVQTRAITYKELHEKQMKEKEEQLKKEELKKQQKKEDEINKNMINIMFDL